MDDLTERVINAAIKGAIGGGLIAIVFYGGREIIRLFSARVDSVLVESDTGPELKNGSPSLIGKDALDVENGLWAKALDDYESSIDKGLYARLFSKHSGDEKKIKAEYLGLKFQQYKEVEASRHLKDHHPAKSAPHFIDSNSRGENWIYGQTKRSFRGVEYFVLRNGAIAISNGSVYRVYDCIISAMNSINNKLDTNMHLTKGLVAEIKAEDEASKNEKFRAISLMKLQDHTPKTYLCNNCHFQGSLLLVSRKSILFGSQESLLCPACGNREK